MSTSSLAPKRGKIKVTERMILIPQHHKAVYRRGNKLYSLEGAWTYSFRTALGLNRHYLKQGITDVWFTK